MIIAFTTIPGCYMTDMSCSDNHVVLLCGGHFLLYSGHFVLLAVVALHSCDRWDVQPYCYCDGHIVLLWQPCYDCPGVYRSPPGTLPVSLQAQGFFMTPPTLGPPLAYYEGSPPFSPPPGMYPPLLYSPYFPPQYPNSSLGYGPPPPMNQHQVPSMVPYNMAN